MTPPNAHYTRARRIRRHRLTGVYTTHEARRLRRRRVRREAVTRGREYAKDALWGALFFLGIWVGVFTLVGVGLVIFG